MEKKMQTAIWGLGFGICFGLAGNEGMENEMETTIMGCNRDYNKDPFFHACERRKS